MAISSPHLSHPPSVVPTAVSIGHVQLRDLLICPKQGIVNYVHGKSILEHDLTKGQLPRSLVDLEFVPNTLAALPVPYSSSTLLAAGGQDAQIHLSLHRPSSYAPYTSRRLSSWNHLLPGSINNSVLLSSLSLTRSNESSSLPRLGVSNNDHTFRLYDVGFRNDGTIAGIQHSGEIRFNVPVNYSAISPDGRTLLSVGDSSTIHLHHVNGGGRVTFNPITTLNLPPPQVATYYSSSHIIASFSAAFSANGSKFAVASQEGVVAVWDVRSSRPMKVFYTNKSSALDGNNYRDGDSDGGWLSDDPFDWTRNNSKAPGWSVRTVKFGGGSHGKEVMAFTEHTSMLHIIDARTFETEEIVHMPDVPAPYFTRPTSQSPSPTTHDAPTLSRFPSNQRASIQALEDTFRISPWRSSMSHISSRTLRDWGRDGEDDIVVVPPLGDRQVEMDIHNLLNRHSRRRSALRYEDRSMDAEEELESDCVSSHTPSRSTSPTPSTSLPTQPSPRRPLTRTYEATEVEPLPSPSQSEVDIAGMCFDPTGATIHVASTCAIASWKIHGAEKKWWVDDRWM